MSNDSTDLPESKLMPSIEIVSNSDNENFSDNKKDHSLIQINDLKSRSSPQELFPNVTEVAKECECKKTE